MPARGEHADFFRRGEREGPEFGIATAAAAPPGDDLIVPLEDDGRDVPGEAGERGDFAAVGQIPDFHGAVVRPRGGEFAIAAHGDAARRRRVARRSRVGLRQFEEPTSFVDGARDDAPAVGGEGRARHPAGVPAQRPHLAARDRVPNADDPFGPAADEVLAIGRVGDGGDGRIAAADGRFDRGFDFGGFEGVAVVRQREDFDEAVPAGGDDAIRIRVEADTRDTAGVRDDRGGGFRFVVAVGREED